MSDNPCVQVYEDDNEAAFFMASSAKVITFHNPVNSTMTKFKSHVRRSLIALDFDVGRWRKTEWGWEATVRMRR